MPQSIRDLRISTNCGACINKCCSQPYDWVYLTEAEIAALERSSGRSAEDFTSERANPDTGAIFRVLNLPCSFLDQSSGRCTVYESRPLVCRLFPFYPEPLTGHATLVPAQCGANLTFHAPEAKEGWTLADYDHYSRSWLRAIWDEAAKRGTATQTVAGSNALTDGSP